MTSWKIRVAVAAASALSIIATTGTSAAQTYKPREKRYPAAQEDQYNAPQADRYSSGSTYDYFFNNPGKYRGVRSTRGEYYPGAIRR